MKWRRPSPSFFELTRCTIAAWASFSSIRSSKSSAVCPMDEERRRAAMTNKSLSAARVKKVFMILSFERTMTNLLPNGQIMSWEWCSTLWKIALFSSLISKTFAVTKNCYWHRNHEAVVPRARILLWEARRQKTLRILGTTTSCSLFTFFWDRSGPRLPRSFSFSNK